MGVFANAALGLIESFPLMRYRSCSMYWTLYVDELLVVDSIAAYIEPNSSSCVSLSEPCLHPFSELPFHRNFKL